jgi:hypothetical protein
MNIAHQMHHRKTISGLLFLLSYATHHQHSKKWISAIQTILAREDPCDV